MEALCTAVLARPKSIKTIMGKKTDKRDVIWIVEIIKHDLVTGSFIPPFEIRQLSEIVRYSVKLTFPSLHWDMD